MVKTKKENDVLTESLNTQVANFSVLYMKLHNYHWYVKGENFFTLHVKFEELYTEAALSFRYNRRKNVVTAFCTNSNIRGAITTFFHKRSNW